MLIFDALVLFNFIALVMFPIISVPLMVKFIVSFSPNPLSIYYYAFKSGYSTQKKIKIKQKYEKNGGKYVSEIYFHHS